MKDLLEYIVKNLVSQPDQVNITEEKSDNDITLNLTVSPEDMGIVIGKSGQTIRSIRKLLIARALAEQSNLKVFVNVNQS